MQPIFNEKTSNGNVQSRKTLHHGKSEIQPYKLGIFVDGNGVIKLLKY